MAPGVTIEPLFICENRRNLRTNSCRLLSEMSRSTDPPRLWGQGAAAEGSRTMTTASISFSQEPIWQRLPQTWPLQPWFPWPAFDRLSWCWI